LRANQIGVVASRFVISTPSARKSATACSLPGLASSRTNNPHLIVIFLLHSMIVKGSKDSGNLQESPLWLEWQGCQF
jgi:hypothetical protein